MGVDGLHLMARSRQRDSVYERPYTSDSKNLPTLPSSRIRVPTNWDCGQASVLQPHPVDFGQGACLLSSACMLLGSQPPRGAVLVHPHLRGPEGGAPIPAHPSAPPFPLSWLSGTSPLMGSSSCLGEGRVAGGGEPVLGSSSMGSAGRRGPGQLVWTPHWPKAISGRGGGGS